MAAATLGCRAHSGWAALVAITGPRAAPSVVDRRIIQLADARLAGSKQPYHAAEGLAFPDAETLINQSIQSTRRLARQGLEATIDDLQSKGYCLAGSGLLLGSGRSLPPLKGILASHALIHAAEGELFRDAFVHACEQLSLPVTGVKERELSARAAADLRLSPQQIQEHLKQLGRSLGPPWREDQKCATLAAWLALTAASGERLEPYRSPH